MNFVWFDFFLPTFSRHTVDPTYSLTIANKTMSESEEKSSLYEIYENQDFAESNDEIYRDLASNLDKSSTIRKQQEEEMHIPPSYESTTYKTTKIILKLAVLGLVGNLYYQLSIHLANALEPLNDFNNGIILPKTIIDNSGVHEYVVHALEGVFLGTVLPLFNHFAGRTPKVVKVSQQKDNTTNLIRPLIATLGIIFAIRKIEWISTSQIAMIWSGLNIALWLFIDSGLEVLIYGALLSAIGLISHNQLNLTPETAVLVDYLWFGGLLFGKVGRALF